MRSKVALWGFGQRGKRYRDLILGSLNDMYELVAVFDKNWKRLSEASDYPVSNPDSLIAMFNDGAFDAVIVAIAAKETRLEIEKSLQASGIPTWDLFESENFAKSARFTQASSPGIVLPHVQEYDAFALEDMLITYEEPLRTCYVFGRNGKVDFDYWHEYILAMGRGFECWQPDFHKLQIKELPGEFCVINKCWNQNYWHFVYECLDQVYLMEKAGFTGTYIMPAREFAHQLMELMGVPRERHMTTRDLEIGTAYALETLYVLAPRTYAKSNAPYVAAAADKIKAALALPSTNNSYPERIFVKRIGGRKLLIPDELLAEYGVTTIVPEELSGEEQIGHFHHAKVVLSPHGANTANCAFMQSGSVLIETFPNNYINPCCLNVCAEKDIRYIQLTEENSDLAPDNTTRIDSYMHDYSIRPELIERAMRNAELLAEA